MSNTSTTDEFDLWAGESGFKDDYDGLITDAFFTKDASYNNGQTLFLSLQIIADDGEEVEQRYPCGADWDSFDNGETATHPKDRDGKPKTFNHNSAMFGLMKGGFEAGAEEVLRGRGSPRNAAIWKGLKFHWKVDSRDISIRDRETGNQVTRTVTRTYPEKYVGAFDVESGNTPAPAASAPAQPAPTQPSAPAASAPAASSNGSVDLSVFNPELVAKLKIQAKTKAYPEFLDAALAIDGVTMDDAILNALSEESFYQALKG